MSRRLSLPAVLGALAALSAPARLLPAQSPALGDAPSPAPAHASAPSLVAREIHEPLVIDGRLDEAEWADAAVATGFIQSEPHGGAPASEPTEVRVLYDAERLYIGARLDDRNADAIVVNDLRKDFNAEQQDAFEVIIDTFRDRRNGYVFMTNAAGARADWQVANEGREINRSWDGVWTVRTQRDARGWTVEMAIPFRTLRFDFSRSANWGINFARRIRRRNEVSYWAPVPRAYSLTRVSLAGLLGGVAHQGTSRDLRIKPYVAGRAVRETGAGTATPAGATGVDLKYGLTPALALDVAVNPDFAQAEADEQQVNLTQFSQFYPEKREFFLENSGVFYVGDASRNNRVSLSPTPDEDMLLFFSRRIGLSPDGRSVPIPGGVRVTGRALGVALGALSMRTGATSVAGANQYSVLRLRRNLFSASDVGFIALDREGTGAGDWNRLAGVDATFRIAGDWDWSSYAVGSRKPGRRGGQYTYRTSLNHDGTFLHVKAGVLEIGPGFSDDLGYFRRTNTRKYILDTGVRPRPRWLTGTGIREMHPHVTWNYYETLAGDISAKNLHSGYSLFFQDGAYLELSVNPTFQRLTAPFRISPSIAPIPPGGYAWTDYQLRGGTDASRPLSASYSFITGGLWSGRQRTQQVTLSSRFSPRVTTSLGVSHTAATLQAPAASFEALLWTSRTTVAFTTSRFLDALAQYDPRQRVFNANVRLNVIHHPLSDLFIVLNEQRISTPGAPASGFGVIVKLTQMMSL